MEELEVANRRMEEELSGLYKEIAKMRRTSSPPSPIITRARAKTGEKEEGKIGDTIVRSRWTLRPQPVGMVVPQKNTKGLPAGMCKPPMSRPLPVITGVELILGDGDLVSKIADRVLMKLKTLLCRFEELLRGRLPPPLK